MPIRPRRRARRLAAAAAVAVLCAAGGAAHGTDLRPVNGRDQRHAIEPAAWPWTAIGRVNRTSGGFCTGVLVAPQRVLTAAHCVYDDRRRRWMPPGTIHFVAGYSRDQYVAHSVASVLRVPEGYRPGTPGAADMDSLGRDWAVLELARPVAVEPIPWQAVDAGEAADLPVLLAGYRRDWAHVLSADPDCRLLGTRSEADLLLHDCAASFGDSGSPLLVERDGGFFVIGVHVAILESPEAPDTLRGLAAAPAALTAPVAGAGR
jgi:protease YdgD